MYSLNYVQYIVDTHENDNINGAMFTYLIWSRLFVAASYFNISFFMCVCIHRTVDKICTLVYTLPVYAIVYAFHSLFLSFFVRKFGGVFVQFYQNH